MAHALKYKIFYFDRNLKDFVVKHNPDTGW